MASRKDLKKVVRSITSELFIVAYCKGKELGKADQTAEVLKDIIDVEEDFIARISHTEPGQKAKAYYAVFKKDFDERVSGIIDKIEQLK